MNLFYGDCLNAMKSIPSESVDCIITDLPFGITGLHWDVAIDLKKLWSEYRRVTKQHSPIVLFCAEPFASKLLMSNQEEWRHTFFWVKTRATLHMNSKFMPMKKVEQIHVFGKARVRYRPPRTPLEKPYVDYNRTCKSVVYGGGNFTRPDKTKRLVEYESQTDVLFFNSLSPAERLMNTQKPVELLEFLVETYSNENDVVLDSTMGSGTTGVACQKLNRKFIGIEKNKDHYLIAFKRLHGLPISKTVKLKAIVERSDNRLREFVVSNYDAIMVAYQNRISFTELSKIIYEIEEYYCKWISLRNTFYAVANDRGDNDKLGLNA
jgi:DNA modification methylase